MSSTGDHSTMAVGYKGPAYTYIDIPANMETGATKIQVVVNGIASQSWLIGSNEGDQFELLWAFDVLSRSCVWLLC